jgi:hypothetical protein
MSNCSDFRTNQHDFRYISDSNIGYKNILNNSLHLYDEIEPIENSLSIAISVEDAVRLFNESKKNNVALNTKIKQVIKDHLDWHANAADAKMIYMPKPWISKIVNQLTEQQISAIARDVSKEFKDICLMLRGEFTMQSFLDVIITWLRVNGTPSRQIQKPNDFRLLVKHDMGYNYSLLVKEIFRCIVDIFHIEIESIVTENMLVLRILMMYDPIEY